MLGGMAYGFVLGLLLLSLLLSMLGCMDAQGVLSQNRTILPIQSVCQLSVIFEDSGPNRN